LRSSAPSGTARAGSSSCRCQRQALLTAATLADQVVPVVEQKLQLAQALLAGSRVVEARLAQRRPGDCERVDRIRLAAAAAAGARAPDHDHGDRRLQR
jgi:hypothetical protein